MVLSDDISMKIAAGGEEGMFFLPKEGLLWYQGFKMKGLLRLIGKQWETNMKNSAGTNNQSFMIAMSDEPTSNYCSSMEPIDAAYLEEA